MKTINNQRSKNYKEPLAIIGMGCRFPGGASSPEKLWDILKNKKDAIIEIPKERWDSRRFYDPDPNKPGKIYVKEAGFLEENIKAFDPLFFGISPREAHNLDPQQRLLLETTYEAIEDAGLQLEKIKETDVGVYIGGFFLDYLALKTRAENRPETNAHTGVGFTMSMLSNRISYAFDLQGASVSIDTACSSSLTALHFACQSLWNKENSMAVVGGVNALLLPDLFIGLAKGKFLSSHARCKTFDEQASGYVRGEGAGTIILKPYSKAVEDKDHIYACIKASGVNQDGHTSAITVPNTNAQEKLLKKVYSEANVNFDDVHYIEAHGTGTQLGDKAELRALNAIFSNEIKNKNKVIVGSIKTNVGHLEAASGVASVIKAALCLKHNKVPANLHFHNPNPKLNYENLNLRVPIHMEQLPEKDLSYAGINSFGYGGSNAHVVLQQISKSSKDLEIEKTKLSENKELSKSKRQDSLYIVPITARSEDALKTLASDYSIFLKTEQLRLNDFLHSLVYRRSHHSKRLAIVASNKEEIIEKLDAFSRNQLMEGVTHNESLKINTGDSRQNPKLVFVFTGMGPQWWKMGRELMQKEPLFLKTIEECDRLLYDISGWSLMEELLKSEEESCITSTDIAQPANFAIQVALCKLWKKYGVTPDAVVGHSIGEVASAHISGALSLEDGLRVSYHRSRLQKTTAGKGTMLAVGLPEKKVNTILKDLKNVSIGAVNSPNSVTLAGNEFELSKISELLDDQNIFNRMLEVEIPYHSPYMDPLENELITSLEDLEPLSEKIPLYSTVTTKQIHGETLNASYWWKNVREPVHFSKTMNTLLDNEYRLFLEIGPHPVLRNSIKECLTEAFIQAETFSSLNRKKPELFNFYENLSILYTYGFEIDWSQIVEDGNFIKLPIYPWQRDEYWIESQVSLQDRIGLIGHHIFCNTKPDLPLQAYEVELNELFFPYLKDHMVQDFVVFPGAGYIEAGLALWNPQMQEGYACTLENLEFGNMLTINDNEVKNLYLSMDSPDGDYSVNSKINTDETIWLEHAKGKVLSSPLMTEYKNLSLDDIRSRCPDNINIKEFYHNLLQVGLSYGTHFRTIKEIKKGKDELLAIIEGHSSRKDDIDGYFLHPTILDGAIQCLAAFFDKLVVPVSVGKVYYFASPGNKCFCHLEIINCSENSIRGNIILCDDDGKVYVKLEDIKCQRISKKKYHEDLPSSWTYQIDWEKTKTIHPDNSETKELLVFAEDYEYCQPILEKLYLNGYSCTIVSNGPEQMWLDDKHIQINFKNADEFKTVFQSENISGNKILYLWNPNQYNYNQLTVADCTDVCMSLLYAIQAINDFNLREQVQIFMVTQKAQIVVENDKGEGIAFAPLSGLGQLINNEYPDISGKIIDVESIEKDFEFVINELSSGYEHNNIAYRETNRYIKRIMPFTPERTVDRKKETKIVSTNDVRLKLSYDNFGDNDDFNYIIFEEKELESDEIEVKVSAATINFKDFLKVKSKIALKAIEGTYFENTIGMECVGTVTKVGSEVTNFKIGDTVVASPIEGAFRTHTVLKEGHAFKKSIHQSEIESLYMIPFLTIMFGLENFARLKKSEKILIHNATGAVGLAAIQYAKFKKAEIYATAGSKEKRDYLRSLGIQHIADSRSLEFVSYIKDRTNNKGVDVILSSQHGEAMKQSLSLLAPYGRFVEIGKRDIIENTGLPMHVFNNNIQYTAIDIDKLLADDVPKIRQIGKKVIQFFNDGHFMPLPTTVYSANETKEAFKHYQTETHIGRVAITYEDQEIEIKIEEANKLIAPNAAYLITGGTKGFGLEVAKWLSTEGAGKLILASRSGKINTDAEHIIEEMEKSGTNIDILSCDVSDEKDVKNLFDRIAQEKLFLKGIIHSAMVLDDAYLPDMNRERFHKVMQPKVAGAIHLDKYSREHSLDFFVCFSSVSSLIGTYGQANYIAANAFLDAFAYLRRQNNFPATTINLGLLSETGVAFRSENVKSEIENLGVHGISTQQVISALKKIIPMDISQIGLFDVDWKVLPEYIPGIARASFFQKIVGDNSVKENITLKKMKEDLSSKSLEERKDFLKDVVAKEIAQILKVPLEMLSQSTPLMEQGVDSLLTSEILTKIDATIGVRLSPSFFFSYPTIEKIVGYLIEKVFVIEDEIIHESKQEDEEVSEDNSEELLDEIEKLLI